MQFNRFKVGLTSILSIKLKKINGAYQFTPNISAWKKKRLCVSHKRDGLNDGKKAYIFNAIQSNANRTFLQNRIVFVWQNTYIFLSGSICSWCVSLHSGREESKEIVKPIAIQWMLIQRHGRRKQHKDWNCQTIFHFIDEVAYCPLCWLF